MGSGERRPHLGSEVQAEPLQRGTQAGRLAVAEERRVLDHERPLRPLPGGPPDPGVVDVPDLDRTLAVEPFGPVDVGGAVGARVPRRGDVLGCPHDAHEPGVGQAGPQLVHPDPRHLVAYVARGVPLGRLPLVVVAPPRVDVGADVGQAVGEVEEPLPLEQVGRHLLDPLPPQDLEPLHPQHDLGMLREDLGQGRGAGPSDAHQEERGGVGHALNLSSRARSRVSESNRRLSHYKGDALPTELTRRVIGQCYWRAAPRAESAQLMPPSKAKIEPVIIRALGEAR